MVVPDTVLSAATSQLDGAGSTLWISAVTLQHPGHLDAQELTGTMTVGADGSKTIDPPNFGGPPPPDPNTDAFLQSQPEIRARTWAVCFNSAYDDASDASTFHAQCDEHDVTVSIASNSLGFVFGGFVSFSRLDSFCSQMYGHHIHCLSCLVPFT